MKNIRIILATLIIIFACGSGFYFWAQNYAQEQLSEAQKEITIFVKSKLDEDIDITYDFKEFALISQTINLENLSVKGSFVEFKIPKLSISVNEDILSIKNLEGLEVEEIGESGALAEISSLKISSLNIEKLLRSKNLLDLYSNLEFENFEILDAKVNLQSQGVTPTELSSLSIDKANSGNLEKILLEGLVVHTNKYDPIISLESASVDKISDLAPLFESIERGDSYSIIKHLSNLSVENFEILDAKVNLQSQGVTPTELSHFSINLNSGNLEKILLEGLVVHTNKYDPIISLESASVDKISDLAPLFESIERGDSYSIIKHLSNLSVENFEIFDAKVNLQSQGVTPTELSHFSINLNSGNLEKILLEGLVVHTNKYDPIISLESASVDKISDLAPLFESIERGDSNATGRLLANLLDLGSFEIKGIEVKDPTLYDSVYLDSFSIKLGREDKLVGSVDINLTGFEVGTSLLEELELPPEVIEALKEDKLKLNASLNSYSDFNIAESTGVFSIGFDNLGKFTFEVVQGGYTKDVAYKMYDIYNQDFVNKLTLKLIKFSFTNEGLIEILMNEAQKNMNLSPIQMIQMVSQEIDNSGEFLSYDLKEKMKKAVTTFIKSGKSIEISIKSVNKDGVSLDELNQFFTSGQIENFIELDILSQ